MIKSGRKTGNRRPRPFFFPSPFASQSRTSFLFSFKKKKKRRKINRQTNEKRTEIDPSFPFSSKFSANSSIFSFWFESKNQTDRSFHGNGRGFSELTRDCKHLPFEEKKKKKNWIGNASSGPPSGWFFTPKRERERGEERETSPPSLAYTDSSRVLLPSRATLVREEKRRARVSSRKKRTKRWKQSPRPRFYCTFLFFSWTRLGIERKKEKDSFSKTWVEELFHHGRG